MKDKKQKIGIGNYLKKHKLGIFLYILVYAIAGACTVATTILSANAIVCVSDDIKNYDQAILLFCIALGLYVVRRTCWYVSGIIYHKVANKIMVDLNYDISNQAFKLNSKTYSDNNTGTFVQRMVYEPERVVSNLSDLVDMITDIITSLVIVTYIATLNWILGVILLAVAVSASIIEKYRITTKQKNQKILREKTDKVNSIATEIVHSEKDIKSLGLEEKLSEVSKNSFLEYTKANYKTQITDMNFWTSRNLIIEVIGAVLLILGVMMREKAMISLSTFMLVYSNHGYLFNLVWSLGNILDYFVNIKVSSERMFELFNEKLFPAEKFGNVSIQRVKGQIDFRRVNFSFTEYEERPDKSKMTRKERKEYKKNPPERKIKSVNKIFESLSFSIKPNTTVAFVGKSGSGKSTILNLMSKMYEVDGGKVLIDGVNINDLDKETLRNNISLVNQFPYIFDMTIKENLLLAKKDATEQEIFDAIKKASMLDFVNSLSEGINTKVGESGIKLSGGQKQRLAIARALLRNSPIIIFDESTSSLDNFAQEEVKQSIDNLKGQGTIVIVAHRLSTIRNADKIFFLDEGKIIDSGTFEELFEKNDKFMHMFYAENLR